MGCELRKSALRLTFLGRLMCDTITSGTPSKTALRNYTLSILQSYIKEYGSNSKPQSVSHLKTNSAPSDVDYLEDAEIYDDAPIYICDELIME